MPSANKLFNFFICDINMMSLYFSAGQCTCPSRTGQLSCYDAPLQIL